MFLSFLKLCFDSFSVKVKIMNSKSLLNVKCVDWEMIVYFDALIVFRCRPNAKDVFMKRTCGRNNSFLSALLL